jgi:hypothetical protein
MAEHPMSTRQKALALNLDRSKYGTLAEIGAGQEVARWFFLVDYLSRYTDRLIGIAAGLPSIAELADERYYQDLGGGMLESTGGLFKRSVKVYVYPKRDTPAGPVITVETMPIIAVWRHLRDYLLESGRLVPIQRYDESLLSIYTKDVLARIQSGDASWETMVPPAVAETIRTKRLFGLKA